MKEEWRDVKGYEGLYQVSNLGKIKSLNRIDQNNHLVKEKIKNQRADKNGYKMVTLSKDRKKRNFKVHRLVAEAFIPNPDNKPEVNHINGNKTDNRTNKLEWVTHKENIVHSYKTKLRKTKIVIQYNLQGAYIKTWNSIISVEKELGIRHSDISACCKGKRKTTGGYIWRYANKNP